MAAIKGGDKFAQALSKIAKTVSKPATLQVGFFENATYPDGTSVAMVAATQDFGSASQGIPPRPFFRNMVAKQQKLWPKAIAANLKANNYDAEKTLAQLGPVIVAQLQQSIQDTNSPPLKPATVARKGFDKPLIDTAQMINSVAFRIKT